MLILVLMGLIFIFFNSVGNVSAASGNSRYVSGSSGNDSWDVSFFILNKIQ